MGILSDVLKGMGLNSFQRALGAVLTLAVGLILIKYLMKLVGRALSRSRLEKAAHSMVLGILQVTLYLLLGINVASALGIDVTGVVAVASVLTLAVSLAMQKFANQFGGRLHHPHHPPLPLRRLCGDRRAVRHGAGDQHDLHPPRHL